MTAKTQWLLLLLADLAGLFGCLAWFHLGTEPGTAWREAAKCGILLFSGGMFLLLVSMEAARRD